MKIWTNSPYAWLLASRPKTLTAALSPVLIATALAWRHPAESMCTEAFWLIAVLCLLFAGLMQIAANFINDYYDFMKGTDGEDRLGPERACAQGWITPGAMKVGIGMTLLTASVTGLAVLIVATPYITINPYALIALGAACIVFAFLYTTLLSYCGGGDVLVWAFFGFVPIVGTHYVLTGMFTPQVWILAAATGLVTDTLLVLNNYRDRDTDRVAGKRTLIVALGERFGEAFYLWQGLLGAALAAWALGLGSAFPYLLYVVMHLRSARLMRSIKTGRALNGILGLTALNILIFGLCTLAVIVV